MSNIEWEDLNFNKFVMYGAIASGSLQFVSYPADVLKTRLQIQQARLDTSSMHVYKNTFDAISKIKHHEGLRGFYKGYGIQLFAMVPTVLVYFGSYEYSKYLLKDLFFSGNNEKSYMGVGAVNFLAGAIAEITSTVIWLPFEIVSQKMQIQGPLKEKKFKNSLECARETFRNEGIKGFYRGSGATFLTVVPSGSVSWATYEILKKWISKYFSEKEEERSILQENVIHMFAGAGAGFFSFNSCKSF
eukprot:TRINITY_DN9189_c0_g1_i1.p1 TRINITY_DN9189_c0_g1~~TRINITY_DN9189_c0_g1_i1.p1  ORF type:complete len:245 (-),score=38.43 TRINITY_DN9189_c0_g1_i1:149-883(-)